MDRDKINKQVNETLTSFDGAEQAAPAPFLHTRINARLQQQPANNFWAGAVVFISRPLVAGFGIAVFIIINTLVISTVTNTPAVAATNQSAATKYDFAINVSSIYDIENQEP